MICGGAVSRVRSWRHALNIRDEYVVADVRGRHTENRECLLPKPSYSKAPVDHNVGCDISGAGVATLAAMAASRAKHSRSLRQKITSCTTVEPSNLRRAMKSPAFFNTRYVAKQNEISPRTKTVGPPFTGKHAPTGERSLWTPLRTYTATPPPQSSGYPIYFVAIPIKTAVRVFKWSVEGHTTERNMTN